MAKCKISWCVRDARSHGYCWLHFKRWKRGGDLEKPIRGTLKKCTVEGCNRDLLCNGFCNAHNIRFMKGQDLNTPIKEKNKLCSVCGSKIGHGGNGLCRRHYIKWLKQTRTKKFTEMLGGRCNHCNKQYPPSVYDFHHINPKNKLFSISSKIVMLSEKEIEEEVKKCQLLCANCHRILHYEI